MEKVRSFLAMLGRHWPTLFLTAALGVISLWPQKNGDLRIAPGGLVEIYWRGPVISEDGRWLRYVVDGAERKPIDAISIGGGNYLVAFDDDTALVTTASQYQEKYKGKIGR